MIEYAYLLGYVLTAFGIAVYIHTHADEANRDWAGGASAIVLGFLLALPWPLTLLVCGMGWLLHELTADRATG